MLVSLSPASISLETGSFLADGTCFKFSEVILGLSKLWMIRISIVDIIELSMVDIAVIGY